MSKNWIFSIQSSFCNYWRNSRYLTRKTFRRTGSWNTCCVYKIINIVIPKYLNGLIPKPEIGYYIRNRNKSLFDCRTQSFKSSFFPYTIVAWYSLDPSIINPLCSCSLEVENTLHFFLHHQHYSNFRMGLVNKINQIDENFPYLITSILWW